MQQPRAFRQASLVSYVEAWSRLRSDAYDEKCETEESGFSVIWSIKEEEEEEE